MRTYAPWAALALAGCILVDTRGEADLEITGGTLTRASLDIVVHAEHGDRAAIEIDGRDLPDDVAVNVPVRIDLPGDVSDGRHAIRARVLLSYVAKTQALEFVLDRTPPGYQWDPAPGVVGGLVPFQATLTAFDALSSVPDDGASLTVTPAGFAVVRPLGGGRFRVESDQPLEGIHELSVQGTVQDAVGNVARVSGRWWWAWWEARYVTGSFDALAYAPGTVRIAGSLTGCPGACPLEADGVPLTTLGVGPFAYDWDTRAVPEGTYHLRVTAPGWVSLDGPDAVVDRTSPAFLACELPAADPGDYGVRDPIAARYDERLYSLAGGGYLTLDGVRQGYAVEPSPPDPEAVALCMSGEVRVPSTLALVVPAGAMGDLVGNPAPASQCTIDLPVWRRPAGAGPASVGGQPIDAVEIAALVGNGGFGASACHTPRDVSWFWISPDELLRSNLGALQRDPARRAVDLAAITGGAVAWSEVDPITSKGKVHFTQEAGGSPVSAPVNRDVAADARQPSLCRDQFYRLLIAWSEATASGGRAIQVGRLDGTLNAMPPASDDPAASAESPTVAYDGLFAQVAFVERTGGSPAQLVRKRYWGPNWEVLSSGKNVDPALDAAEPSLAENASVLAWTEGGNVYASNESGLPPTRLNTHALRRARSPHAFVHGLWAPPWELPGVVFVEEGPQGDRVVVRLWDGTSWTTLPDANADVPGPVARLHVQAGWPLSVAWVDDQSRVYLRVYNE